MNIRPAIYVLYPIAVSGASVHAQLESHPGDYMLRLLESGIPRDVAIQRIVAMGEGAVPQLEEALSSASPSLLPVIAAGAAGIGPSAGMLVPSLLKALNRCALWSDRQTLDAVATLILYRPANYEVDVEAIRRKTIDERFAVGWSFDLLLDPIHVRRLRARAAYGINSSLEDLARGATGSDALRADAAIELLAWHGPKAKDYVEASVFAMRRRDPRILGTSASLPLAAKAKAALMRILAPEEWHRLSADLIDDPKPSRTSAARAMASKVVEQQSVGFD